MQLDMMVTWSSQAGGVTKVKVGRIVEIVQPGCHPNAHVDTTALPRNHVSYVVRVDEVGKHGVMKTPKFYWPRVSALTVL